MQGVARQPAGRRETAYLGAQGFFLPLKPLKLRSARRELSQQFAHYGRYRGVKLGGTDARLAVGIIVK